MLKQYSSLSTLLIVTVFALAGCDLFTGTAGRITVKLKDAPFPYDFVSEANVTVNRIEVLGTNGTQNWLIADVAQPLNLLDFRDGKTATVVPDIEIPAGTYDRLRIYVNQTGSVVLTDGTRHNVSSGSDAPIVVQVPEFKFDQGGDEAEAIVDFVMDDSFVAQGDDPSTLEGITGFAFSPTLVAESFKLNNETMEIPAQ